LTCDDGTGWGCDKTYYSTDGSPPNTVYSTPINISVSTTLKFFSKDKANNTEAVRTEIYLIDTVAPVGTASPEGGFYSTGQLVTLTCNDVGLGCENIYYTTNGETPTTSSQVYSSPLNISVTTVLKFFARDKAGNNDTIKTHTYIIDQGGCSNPPIKIGSTHYISLQAAYNAAVNGDVIKCRVIRFIENLTVNRNITVTLEGGYDCNYTSNTGGKTSVKGMVTTTSGGGTITIKNFILEY
jgi:hypothetical protein